MNAVILMMLSVFPLKAQVLPITINCGSPTDQHFTASPPTVTYTDPNLPAGFSTMRYGTSVHYRVPIASGAYVLFLTFVEPNKTAVGQRIMSVTVGGQVSQNFDVFALGGNKDDVAVRLAYLAIVQTDVLDLTVTGVLGNAILSRIEVAGVAVPDPTNFVNPN